MTVPSQSRAPSGRDVVQSIEDGRKCCECAACASRARSEAERSTRSVRAVAWSPAHSLIFRCCAWSACWVCWCCWHVSCDAGVRSLLQASEVSVSWKRREPIHHCKSSRGGRDGRHCKKSRWMFVETERFGAKPSHILRQKVSTGAQSCQAHTGPRPFHDSGRR